MARLTGNYTDIQQELLDQLTEEAKTYKKRADELQKKLKDNPLISFEENKKVRKAMRTFQEKYQDTVAQIDDIMNAQYELNDCLRRAKNLMARAERLMQTYGLEYTGDKL